MFLSPFCPKRMGEKISNLCPKLWTNPFEKCKFCDFLNKSDVFIVKKGYLSIYSTSPNTFKNLKRKEGKFSRLTKILGCFCSVEKQFFYQEYRQNTFFWNFAKKTQGKEISKFWPNKNHGLIMDFWDNANSTTF